MKGNILSNILLSQYCGSGNLTAREETLEEIYNHKDEHCGDHIVKVGESFS